MTTSFHTVNFTNLPTVTGLTTNPGDLIVGASPGLTTLGLGADGNVLSISGGNPTWSTPTSSSPEATDIFIREANISLPRGQSTISYDTEIIPTSQLVDVTSTVSANASNDTFTINSNIETPAVYNVKTLSQVDTSDLEFNSTITFADTETKILASDAGADDDYGTSSDISGYYAIVGASLNDDVGTSSGSAYIYKRNEGGIGNWGEIVKLTASNAVSSDQFGNDVAIDGEHAIVGAFNKSGGDPRSGSAYIFNRNQGGTDNWGEVIEIEPSDTEIDKKFGISVSISGDYAIAGADEEVQMPVGNGSAYIFNRNQGGVDNWGQVVKLTASDGSVEDRFGNSVGISGDYAVVGAPSNDDVSANSGSAYIFYRNQGGANNWGEVTKITASDIGGADNFGISAAISGNNVIIGAWHNNVGGFNSGSAYIFNRNKGGIDNWGEVTRLDASDASSNDEFGISVAIDQNYAIVGAESGNSNTGSAYVFQINQGGINNWGELAKIIASDAANNDRFGVSVGVSGNTFICGARRDFDAGIFSGSAYLFDRRKDEAYQVVPRAVNPSISDVQLEYNILLLSGEIARIGFTVTSTIKNDYDTQYRLDASDGAADDRFGDSCDIDGDTALVGARRNDDGGTDSGSAYIFYRDQGGVNNWGQVKKLTASDDSGDDQFGVSASLSGDIAVVGAFKNDDVGSDSGSAYIFSRDEGGADNWGQIKKLTANDAATGDRFGISVSVSGDYVAVGAEADDDSFNESGSIYLYKRDQGGVNNWGLLKKIVASDPEFAAALGTSVAIKGDDLISGAPFKNENGTNSGVAYIFNRIEGGVDNWGEVTKVIGTDTISQDRLGESVDINGEYAIVGSTLKNNMGSDAGAVYIFSKSSGWNQVAKLLSSDLQSFDQFGSSVSITDNYAIVGARGEDSLAGISSGAAYLFYVNQGGLNQWGQVSKIVADDAAGTANFGISARMNETDIIIGANQKDDNGAAYIQTADEAPLFSRLSILKF